MVLYSERGHGLGTRVPVRVSRGHGLSSWPRGRFELGFVIT